MVGSARIINRAPVRGTDAGSAFPLGASPPLTVQSARSVTPMGGGRAPLAIQEIIELEDPPPSYTSTCRQHNYPRLRCPTYSKVVNTLVLALVTYLVYYDSFFVGTILKHHPNTDCIIQGGEDCQSLDIISLYGENKTCPYRNFLSGNLQINVCQLFKDKALIDIRLFNQGLPTDRGVLIEPVDFTYIITSLRPEILSQLHDILHQDGN